eukprot:3424682-Amphidinium_carterae.1
MYQVNGDGETYKLREKNIPMPEYFQIKASFKLLRNNPYNTKMEFKNYHFIEQGIITSTKYYNNDYIKDYMKLISTKDITGQ